MKYQPIPGRYKAERLQHIRKSPRELVNALLKVPEANRLLLQMYLEGKTVAALSKQSGLSPSTVHKKLGQGFYYLDKYFDLPVHQYARRLLYGRSPDRVSY